MKFLATLLIIIPIVLFGQQPEMSQKSQQDLTFIKRNSGLIIKETPEILAELPVVKLNGEYYVSFLGSLRENTSLNDLPESVIVGKGTGKIRSVRIKLNALNSISELMQFEYLELAGKINPKLDKVLGDTRADSVHAGYNLPQSFTGKDVLIGVNDWGFDYTSPMFYDTLLQNSRILAAWDQFKQSGPNPQDYSYGTEYNTISSLLAAQSDTSNQLSYSTHGTHVAGITGGSGAGVISKGLAFESKFLFTTILVDEAAALDSWNWMYEKSVQEQKRLVINMSWGLYHFGTNDGTSLLSQAITDFTNQGVLFVSSAGNNGDVNFHFERTFNNDSIKSRVSFYNYALHDSLWGQSLHGWGEIGNNFEVKLQFKNTAGIVLGETNYYSTGMNGFDQDYLILNTADTVWFDIAAQSSHPQNSRPTVRFRVKKKQIAIILDLVVKANTGKVHFWNLVELTTNGGNWGMPFSAQGNGYIAGNNLYGIGEPACADDAITIASHVAKYLHTNGTTWIGGDRSTFSSIGPRYDEVRKPDVSAPGSGVLSSISSFTDDTYTTVTSTTFQGRTYNFARFSGTSMASPVVAGVCALIWEANPYLSPRQVKLIIIESALEDNKTGIIPDEGSTSWGFGKVNALFAVQKALTVVGVENEAKNQKTEWSIYPNPSNSSISVNGFNKLEYVHLIDVTGKEIILDETKRTWEIDSYKPGVYLLRIISEGKVYQKKVVIQ